MMKRRSGAQLLGWVGVILLVLLIQPLSRGVDFRRTMLGMKSPTPLTKIVDFDPTAVTGVIMGAALGGFQGVAASMMWMKMEELWDSGEGTWLACLNVMRNVTLLDPHWLEPWRILGWHLAYNLYVETDDPQLKATYLAKAIAAYKEGISWNPNVYDLYAELGWTYLNKVRDPEQATKWLIAAIQFEHPEYIERMVAHAYEQMPDMDRALDWWDFCLKRNPADETAKGATTTIRLRYLPPWRLMQQGDYEGALKEIDEVLAVSPNDTLPLHIKAYIYERAGRLREALDTWQVAAKVTVLNQQAARKVEELSTQLGLPVPPEQRTPSFLLQQMEKGRLAVPAPNVR